MEETEGGEEGKGRKGGRGISSASRLDQRQNERKEGDDGHRAKKKICTARASERASERAREGEVSSVRVGKKTLNL